MLLPWLVVATILGSALAVHPVDRRITDVDDPIPRGDGVNYRLPNDTHPETYELELRTRVDIAEFDYSGYVKIGIIVDQTTRSVVLHMRELTVNNVTLTRYNRPPYGLDILPYEYDSTTEFLTITTNGIDLVGGDRLVLEIHYANSLTTNRRGFYRTSYQNAEDRQKWLAATHFEPTSARSAFPCYDEPALKARFTIRITHGKDYHALSNMPESRVENSDDTATTLFTQTPLISTYLIAFVVSDFPSRTNTNMPGVFRHRVYAQPGKIESTTHALNDGVRIQSALENYLQVNFALPKIDLVAVPDLNENVSAIENWGLIVLPEEDFLWNPQTDEPTDQFSVSNGIAHGFAHQWFGNLVSPQFWQYIWVNEGLANLLQHIGTDLVYPEWKMLHIYTANTKHDVLDLDARPSARSMTSYAQSPTEISTLFDYVTSSKSGSVLYMFMHAFTESSFKKGLRYYLTANAYKAVREGDLFDALEKAVKEDKTLDADLNVRDIFSSWSNQPGYPLITVQRNYNTVTLQQHHYMSARTLDNDTATWWVPFNYATSRNPSFDDTKASGWMIEKSQTLDVALSSSDWIVLNKQQSSLYRVLYDEHNYRLLAKQLNSDKYGDIHVMCRSQLLNDLNEFVTVGRVKIDILLDFLAYMSRETEYLPWRTVQPILLRLEDLLSGSEYFLSFRSFMAQILQNYYASKGTEVVPGEAITNKYERRRAIWLACRYRLPACLEDTRKILTQTLQSGSAWPLDPTKYVYPNGMATASEAELEMLWKQLFDTTNVDRIYIAFGFGFIQDVEILQTYLNRTLYTYPNEPTHRDWRSIIFNSALDNSGPLGVRTTIRFIRNAPDFSRFFRSDSIAEMISVISSKNMHADTQIEFEDTLDYLVNGGQISGAVASKAREDMRNRKNEFNRHKPSLDQWFANRSSGTRLYLSTLQYYSFAIVMLFWLVK